MIQKQPSYFHISVQIAHGISRRFRVICCEGIRRNKSCRVQASYFFDDVSVQSSTTVIYGISYALDVRVAFVYYAPVCSHFVFLWLVNVSLCVCIFDQIQFFKYLGYARKQTYWSIVVDIRGWAFIFEYGMHNCLFPIRWVSLGWEIGWTLLLAAHILEWLPVLVVLVVICPDRMIYLDLESLEVPVPHVQLQVYSWVSVVCRVLLCHQWEECESQQCLAGLCSTPFSGWLDSDSYDNPGDSTPTQLGTQIY